MAETRDKGPVALAGADVKVRGGIDPATGYIFVIMVSFAGHRAQVWWQPVGWLPAQDFVPDDFVDYDAFVHDGRFKIAAHTWDQSKGPNGPDHLVFVDLGRVPS